MPVLVSTVAWRCYSYLKIISSRLRTSAPARAREGRIRGGRPPFRSVLLNKTDGRGRRGPNADAVVSSTNMASIAALNGYDRFGWSR